MLYSVSLIFVCKDCRKKFSQMEEFIRHKKLKHLKEFQHVKCIAFEERPFGQESEYTIQIQEEEEEEDGDSSVISCAETISLSSDDDDDDDDSDDLIELDSNVCPGPDPTFDLNSIPNPDGEHGNNDPSNFPPVDLLNVVGINTNNADRSQSYAELKPKHVRSFVDFDFNTQVVQQTQSKRPFGLDPFFINHHQQVEVEIESHHLDHPYYRSSLESNGHNQNEQNSPSAANFPSHNPAAANSWLNIYDKKSFNNTDTADLHTPTILPQQNHLTDNTNSFKFGIGIGPDEDDLTPLIEHHVPLNNSASSTLSIHSANIDDVAGPEADAYSLFTSLIQSTSSPGDDPPDCMSGASSPLPCFYDDDIEMDQDDIDADADVDEQTRSRSAHLDVDVIKEFDPYGITFNIRSDNNENKNTLLFENEPIRDCDCGRQGQDESKNNYLGLNSTELNIDQCLLTPGINQEQSKNSNFTCSPVPVPVASASHGSGSVPSIDVMSHCTIGIGSDVGEEWDNKSVAAQILNKNDEKILENSGSPPFICDVCSMRFPSLSLKEIHQKYRFHSQQPGTGRSSNYYLKLKRTQVNDFYENLNKIRKIL